MESFTNIWDFDCFALVDFLSQSDRQTILKGRKAHTSFIERLPFARGKFRSFLPLFPLAIEQFDLSSYDLVLSSSHCVAKGALTTHEQLHICYMHTPVRYAWDMYHSYLASSGLDRGLKGAMARLFLHRLRAWDIISAARADKIIANSHFVAKRVEKIYSKKAAIIYPPVDTDKFALTSKKDDYYLTCSRLVGYKRVDLIVRAFSQNGKKLVIVGDGEELEALKKIASPNITFTGFASSVEVVSYMQNARAFIYAAIEDFGISVVEALSCGTPVIALGRGGASESVESGISGILYPEQSQESLAWALEEFERNEDKFNPEIIRQKALKFSKQNFELSIKNYIETEYEKFKNR